MSVRHSLLRGILTVSLLAVWAGPAARVPAAEAATCAGPNCLYLPAIVRGCASVGGAYTQGLAIQYDGDNPVRLAAAHAGKNFDLRGYVQRNSGFTPSLVDYGPGSEDPNGAAPQFATLFAPNRIQPSGRYFQMYDWNYGTPPDPGTRGSLLTNRPITAMGLATSAGETLHTPASPVRINAGIQAMVIYADPNSVTIKYTREDSSAIGYTVWVDNICTDPGLLALYQSLDNSTRNTFWGVGSQNYNLPYLTPGQAFGTANGSEIVVAVVDSGPFEDPRSCRGWWTNWVSFGASCPLRNGSTIN